MALTLVTPPAVEPFSLAEVKTHLRVDHTEEDGLIAIYLRAAREYAENWLGRTLVSTTWKLTLDEFPAGEIMLPMPPLRSVNHVNYFLADGSETAVSTDDYYVDSASEPGWVVPVSSWPTPLDAVNAVNIEYVAGYAPTANSPDDLASNIPFNIKAGILLIIGNLYENREENVAGTIVNKLPMGVDMLWRPLKFDLSMA